MGNAVAYFTPVTGVTGGLVIGLAAACLLLLSGDILGASGIVHSVFLTPKQALTDSTQAWKLVFLTAFGFLSTLALGPYFTDDERLGNDPSIPVVSTYGYLLAGLFVGFGTRLGNGCTSGHGICGMARVSKRSIVGVGTFMLVAVATAALTAPDNRATANGTSWLRTDQVPSFYNKWIGLGISCFFLIPTMIASIHLVRNRPQIEQSDPSLERKTSQVTELVDEDDPESAAASDYAVVESPQDTYRDSLYKLLSGALSGMLFATGLAVSGMVQPSKVLGFLNLYLLKQGTWDPTLMLVMLGGVIVSFCAYQFVQGHALVSHRYTLNRPLLTSQFNVPCSKLIDWKLLVGATCFGLGWGVAGLCPGPAMFLAATGSKPVLFFYWPMFVVGSFGANVLRERFK